MQRKRILLVDDNPGILNHERHVLETDYNIIGAVNDGNAVCSEVEELGPDLIVLDISLGNRSGIDIARKLRDQGYAGEIVFLTVHEDPDFVRAAIDAGGRGYVTKSRLQTDLLLAVRNALSRQMFISYLSQPE